MKIYMRHLLYHHHSQKYFTISENAPGIYDKKILFSFFSVIAMLNATSCNLWRINSSRFLYFNILIVLSPFK